MFYVLTFIHVVGCLVLIGVVLLQTGKRADLAGAFGGGGSQTAFGTRGAATFLSKATTAFAVVFMLTSIGLTIVTSKGAGGGSSVLDQVPTTTSDSAPAPAPGDGLAPVEAPTATPTDDAVEGEPDGATTSDEGQP